MLKTIKKYITRTSARKEHNNRITNPLYNLGFNNTVEAIKAINKQILLNELLEASGTDSNNVIAILAIDKAIEDGKALGMITELYTKSETYNQ